MCAKHSPDTPVVGRSTELASLQGAVDRAARGSGSTVLLEGEPGIGKTCLVDAAIRHADGLGLPVWRGAAYEFTGHHPFAPLAEALGLHAPAAGAVEREVEALLTGRTPAALEAAGGNWSAFEFRIGELLLAILDRRTTTAPAVLVLEDLHWADVATLGLLHRMAKAPSALPLLLLGTARPRPRRPELAALVATWERGGAHRVPLAPLPVGACGELVAGLLGRDPGPELLARVTTAGGNPLFVTELIGAMRAEGVLTLEADGRAGVAPGGWPSSLSLTILDRLSYLGRSTLELLGLASVLGSSFTVTDLATLAGRGVAECWGLLRVAVDAGAVVEQGDRLVFRHDLVRDALYEDLPRAVRVGLHADAARLLAATGAPATSVAEHVLRGATGSDGRSLELLRRAASSAAAQAPAVAVELLEAALALAPAGAVRIEVLGDLALALAAAGRHADSVDACRQALEYPLPAQREARLRASLTLSLLVQGQLPAAIEQADLVVAGDGLPAVERARFLAWATVLPLYGGDGAGAMAAAQRADAEAIAAGDRAARVSPALALAHLAGQEGRIAESVGLAGRAAALADEVGTSAAHDGSPHLVHAIVLTDADRLDDAGEAVRRGRRAAELFGDLSRLALVPPVEANRLLLAGQWDDALTELEASSALAEETGTAWQVDVLSLRALLDCHRGKPAEAAEWVRRAEAGLAAGVPAYRVGWLDWARSAVAEAGGNVADALRHLATAWETCVAVGAVREYRLFGPDLARLATEAGQQALAEDVVARLAAQSAANPDIPGLAGAALRARGLVAGDPDLLLEALSLARKGPRRHEWARCAHDAATELVRAGRMAEAGAVAVDALGLYADLGADGDAARARAQWRAVGLRLGVRGRRNRPARGWAALTDTEATVARFVADRLSNPEIAEIMFLSRRTVATHVSHLLAKLGMTSRRQLVEAAGRGPLEQLGQDAEQP